MKYLIPFLLFLTLYGCGGALTEARTDTAASATTDNAAPVTSTMENNKNSDQKIPDCIASNDDATNADIVDYIGKPIKIENLEVAEKDFPNYMEWEDAKKECEKLGRRWRLPTKDELNIMYQNKSKIGGFANEDYWSSTEYGVLYVWNQSFLTGDQFNFNKGSSAYVRAVRTTK